MRADIVIVYVERNSGKVTFDFQHMHSEKPFKPGDTRYLKMIGGLQTVTSMMTDEHSRHLEFAANQRELELLPKELAKKYQLAQQGVKDAIREIENYVRAPAPQF